MKKAVLGLTVAMFALAMVSTDVLAAKGEKKDKGTSVKGSLAVVKNDKGEVTSATITAKDGTVYNVVTTGLSQDLVALDGKKVHAKGEVKEADGKTMLTVNGNIKAAGEKKEGKGKGKKCAEAAPAAGK
ncbi:MAG: hypothetical protein PHI84_11965 [Kiritimatiellae bacterium]|nr:hypothetical protein [Kiritimatiellia bacterium]